MRSPRPRDARAFAVAVAGVVLVAACGGGSATESADTLASSPTFETNDSTSELDVGAGAEPVEPAPDPVDDEPTDAGSTDGEPPEAAPADDDAPAVQPAVLGGRAFAEAVTAESEVATNLLPDLVVDDVGRGTKVNIKNIFPADRPVLLWMWAPH